MLRYILKGSIFVAILFICAGAGFAQIDDSGLFPDRNRRKEEDSLRLKEMLSKQQAEHDKKEHEALLERGDEALQLANQLGKSIASTDDLSAADKQKLASLEKLVTKIRNGLGGSDDAAEEVLKDEPKPGTLKEAFKYLQSTTIQLVDELKKTTRFSISAVAIQTSNTVIRLTRFLRMRK